jgi:hypothetical protein
MIDLLRPYESLCANRLLGVSLQREYSARFR